MPKKNIPPTKSKSQQKRPQERKLEGNPVLSLRLSAIERDPTQPRKNFPPQAMHELQSSIQEVGLIQPLVVEQIAAGRYRLVAGERRLTALERLGWKEAPVVIRRTETAANRLRIQLIENLQRADLQPLEEAAAYFSLVRDFGLKQVEVAEMVKKSEARISEYLRILDFSDQQQERIRTSEVLVTASQLLEITKIPEPARGDLLEQALAGKLTVAKLKQARRLRAGGLRGASLVEQFVVDGARIAVSVDQNREGKPEMNGKDSVLQALLKAAIRRAESRELGLPELLQEIRELM